jgi:hypothetical protein
MQQEKSPCVSRRLEPDFGRMVSVCEGRLTAIADIESVGIGLQMSAISFERKSPRESCAASTSPKPPPKKCWA